MHRPTAQTVTGRRFTSPPYVRPAPRPAPHPDRLEPTADGDKLFNQVGVCLIIALVVLVVIVAVAQVF